MAFLPKSCAFCSETLPAIPPETGDAPVALSDLTRLGMNTTAETWASRVGHGKAEKQRRVLRFSFIKR